MDTILRISDAANLAIHAMAHIAKSGGDANHSVGEIAAEQGVSEAHLSKVMQRLVKVGLLTSRRGPGAALFWVARPARSRCWRFSRPWTGPCRIASVCSGARSACSGLRSGGTPQPRESPGARLHGLARPYRPLGHLDQARALPGRSGRTRKSARRAQPQALPAQSATRAHEPCLTLPIERERSYYVRTSTLGSSMPFVTRGDPT